MIRQCRKCLEWKTNDEFTIPSDIKTRRSRNTCNKCRIKNINEWMDRNRDKVNSNQLRYNRTINGRSNILFNAAKQRAIKKGERFLITIDQVRLALLVGICQRTFLPFDLNTSGRSSESPLSPSIDKIDPSGIYESSNVQYVCWWYNISKQRWSDETVLEMSRQLVKVNHVITR